MFIEWYTLEPWHVLFGATYQDDYVHQGAKRVEVYLGIVMLCFVWGVREPGDV